MILWLHAYKYAYKQIIVETEVPEWARPEYRLPCSNNNDNDNDKNGDWDNSPARDLQSV